MNQDEQTANAATTTATTTTSVDIEEEKSNLYELIGGAEKLREMVDRFYDLMELEPEFASIRVMHPTPLDSSRDKLFWFLSGWMGGPDLYISQFGHPRLRARHLPYAIASDERDQWLRCMAWAMQDVGIAEPLQQHLMQSFYQTADWMRNTPG
ncbi:group II truncated hemoglobin [Undibacterium sp. 14-3-2]|uniref:group II truncated hemoglobin n=1 Tax=Undibacterium sp. 14-3-2 TaxID=2800129 RepID=UPI0019040FCE|nr:group II truncated hemoglobin [Undibacterium sp. 14-3-2]MBK1891043.1 group II truncated hemoglobin [Undibacterium sp. 14-3-2]